MNDDSVTRHPRPPTSMKNAYILFYMRERGQGLQAAVTTVSRLPPLSPNAIKNQVKRKAPDTEVNEVEKQPFIGPLLPSPSNDMPSVPPARDPQADLLKRKIEAVSKPVPLKPSNALLSLTQYGDDDDDDAEDIGEKVETPPPSQLEETTPTPPSSSTPSSMPSIPPSQFYSSPPSTRPAQGTKRKSPDDDDRPLQRFSTTRRHNTHQGLSPKYRFGTDSPYARTSSIKNAMQGRQGKKRPII
jgi:ubiquitin carboxyl-terminal hydrolase 36/42